jgi:hypothetical protein
MTKSEVHYLKPDDNHDEARLELLKSQVQSLNKDQLLTFISQLETSWCLDCKGDRWIPITNGFKQFYNEAELDSCGLPRELDIERVSDQHRRKQRALGEMYHRAVALEVAEEESQDINGNEFKIATRINRLIDMSDDAYETVFRYARQFERINHPTLACADPDANNSLFRCTTMTSEEGELSPFQELLLALLNETYIKNIRKYKGQCCKQITTVDMYHTKAWKPMCTVEEFVYSYAQKETRYAAWKNLTSRGSNAREAIKFLLDSKDIQFPEIKKNRNVWSFNNGLFVGKEWSTKLGKHICRFYPYESSDFRCLDPTIVSAKYFDKNFNHFEHIEDWWDIPTPHFQAILEYQNFEMDVAKWMYVMGGKMCFDVGDIDGWQIIPFLKGIAKSGKSTIITKVFKKFYESEDVRTLSNNVERKFGLSSIYDGFMFIAPEVKGDLCLEQAEFQSLVSGEDISIACKYEKAKSVEWKTPGILGGNEVPNWKDNSGSVLRRILPWNFGKQVQEADPHLDEKLDKELPAILLKCVRAYLDFAQKYSDQDVWNVVPEYFKTIQKQVAMVTNSLQNFLASEKLRYGPDLCCPQKIFITLFNQHCSENNLGKFKFNPDFYAGPFSSKNLEVRTETRVYQDQVYSATSFVFGVDVKEETIGGLRITSNDN